MAKSYRTSYDNRFENWSPRPMRYWTTNKWSKTKTHRIERQQANTLVYREVAAYYTE